MKFDFCLMNPPYAGTLHLNFLKKAIEISNIVINISPVRWLQDPTAKDKKDKNISDYNKYKESISNHIKDLEIINLTDSKKYFEGIQVPELGIYVCDKTGGFDYINYFKNTIFDKLYTYIQNNLCQIDDNKKDGWRVRVPAIVSNSGSGSKRPPKLRSLNKLLYFYNGLKDNKPWYDHYQRNQYTKITDEISKSIKFNSEIESKNFCNSFNLPLVKYIENLLISDVNVANNKILWLGNAINPRTNKIGYISEWTNEDIENFFNLNIKEKEMYKSFLRDFENLIIDWKENKK